MSYSLYTADVSDAIRKRIKVFIFLVVIFMLVLLVRIWYLQILKTESFQGLADSNRVRLISLAPYRGAIKDRNGETLVTIRPSFNLYITPEDTKDLSKTFSLLSKKINFDEEKVRENMKKTRSFKSVLIKADISRDEVALVEENKLQLPGVNLKVEPLRNYIHKELASHVLGYLGEITKEKFKEKRGTSYALGDLIGKDGIEAIYEEELKGEKGYKEIEVDVSGRELKTIRKFSPHSGNRIFLTLDVRIQKVMEDLMKGTPDNPILGSAVVMKVQTGEILGLVSKPSYDPNLFASGFSNEEWQALKNDQDHPLQNRAIHGHYPPASTYKIVTALAALEEKVITPEATVFCPGYFRYGRGTYRCWKWAGHGAVNLYDAIVQSCDVYFYTVGFRLGVDALARYAKKLGLGSFTGINLIGEKAGLVPSKEWKLSNRNEAWLPGETISVAIGQGYNLVTPLQQVNMVSTIGNGGLLLQPYIVKRIEDIDGNIVKEFFPKIKRLVDSSPESISIIRKALLGVVDDKKGTGKRARVPGIRVSGKTGTAQVVRKKVTDMIKGKEIPFEFRDHAWFVAYAPYQKPEVAVSVVIEHGGSGGKNAAPIARKIIEVYNKYYPLKEEPVPEDIKG